MGTCTHGMPSPASCFECMEEGPVSNPAPAPRRPERDGPDISARYDGQCQACNLGIHVDETIYRTTHAPTSTPTTIRPGAPGPPPESEIR